MSADCSNSMVQLKQVPPSVSISADPHQWVELGMCCPSINRIKTLNELIMRKINQD